MPQACLEILLLFLTFLGFQDFGRVFGAIGLGIRVSDTDINDTIGSAGPQTTHQEISAIFLLGLGNRGIGLGQSCLLLYGATSMDFLFVANRRGGVSLGG